MFIYAVNELRSYIYFCLIPDEATFLLKHTSSHSRNSKSPRYEHSLPTKLEADEPFQRGAGSCLENFILCGTFQRPDHSIIRYANTRALCVGLTPACYQCLLLTFPLVPTQPHSTAASRSPDRTGNNRHGLRLSITIIPASTWSTSVEIDRKKTIAE